MAQQPVVITKASGEREPFDRTKLLDSLTRAGTRPEKAEEITAHIERKLEPGMSTAEIYRHAFRDLQECAVPVAARYSLKRAVLELGPTGFPFEEFVKELFASRGRRARTGVYVDGRCARHEIDVLVCDDRSQCFGIEAKFHNTHGIKSDLKTALYVEARFRDVMEHHARKPMEDGGRVTEGWLVTNTKFTSEAVHFAECAGITLLGWNYPKEKSLQDVINEAGVHPITCLTTLTKTQKQRLLKDNVVLCRDIVRDMSVLSAHGISAEKAEKVVEEAGALCV